MKNFPCGAMPLLVAGMLAALAPGSGRAAESHFFQGRSGHGATFYLIGGQYSLYVYAKRPVTGPYDPASKSCIFGGNFQRTWPTHDAMSLGSGVVISTIVPHKIGPVPLAMPAGLYHLYIPPLTTCDWKFVLNSTNQNTAGIAPVTMFRTAGGRTELSVIAAIGDTVQFYAQYRTEHDEKAPVSGTLQLIHDGQVVQTVPLGIDVDPTNSANVFFANAKWDSGDAKCVGKNTVKFIAKIGSAEFTSTMEFTLTE